MQAERVEIDTLHGLSCDLDLTQLPDDALIAIYGANGSGKTTVLECMVPIPLQLAMASRVGPLHERVPPMKRDNVIRTTFARGDHRITSHVEIDPGTGRSGASVSAYLQRDGVTIDATAKGNQREYLDAVAEVMPSAAVVMSSAYSAQGGSGDLLTMAPADRRALFAKLCRAEQDQELASMAAQAAKHARGKLDAAATAADRLAPNEAWADGLRERLRGWDAEIANRAAIVQRVAQVLADARAAHGDIAKARDDLAKAKTRAASLAEAVDVLRRRYADAKTRHDAAVKASEELDALTEPTANDVAKIEQEATAARVHVEQLRAKRDALPVPPAGAASIEDLAQALQAARDAYAATVESAGLAGFGLPAEVVHEAERRADEAQAKAQAAREAYSKARAARDVMQRPPVERARLELDTAERAAALLDRVPCGGGTLTDATVKTDDTPAGQPVDCSTCELLTDARAAAQRVPGLRATLDTMEADAEAYDRADAATAQAAGADADAAQAAATAGAAARVLRRRAQAVTDAAKAHGDAEAGAEAAEERARLTADLERAEAAANDAGNAAIDARALRDRCQVLRTMSSALEESGNAVANAAADGAERRAELDTVNAEIDRLTAQLADDDGGDVIAKAEAAHVAAVESLDAGKGEAAEIRGLLAGHDKRIAEHVAASKVRDVLAEREAGLSTIAEAFGPTGTQAMAIDRAAPSIASTANQLLARTFGGRFAVEIITQRPRKSGPGMVPTLDVVVHDGKLGRAVSPGDLSGGERTILSEAIKLAIAVRHKLNDASGIADLYRDECDGPLDEVAALQYPSLLRAAMQIGGFTRCYFVTHRRDLRDQADARIEVADGGARIVA